MMHVYGITGLHVVGKKDVSLQHLPNTPSSCSKIIKLLCSDYSIYYHALHALFNLEDKYNQFKWTSVGIFFSQNCYNH